MGADNKVTDAAKKRTGALSEAGSAYADAVGNAGGAYQSAIGDANAKYQENLARAEEATKRAYEQAGNDFASIVQGYKDELNRAELEHKKQEEIDQKTVAWTGATELAAAIANMVGVGSFNASNQQIHSFSQDWMKKADQDAKLRRQRIDNLRERQRAMEQQGINLRLQGLNALNKMRTDAAAAGYRGALEAAGAGYKGALDSASAAYKSAGAVAESEYTGATEAAKIGLQEQSQARSAQLQEFAHGAKRDEKGNLVPDTSSPYYIKNTRGTSSGNANLNNYDVTIDGKNYTLSMTKETFNRAIIDGNAELKRDLVEMLGAGSWETLAQDAMQKKDKKKKYLEYSQIINALDGTTRDETGVIEKFVLDHRGELSRFNTHLMRVANNARDMGDAEQARQAPAAAAPVQSQQIPASEEEDTRYNEFN